MISYFSRMFSADARHWLVQYAMVGGNYLDVQSIARRIAKDVEGIEPHRVYCTGKADDEGLQVGTLTVYQETETHGRWCLHKTTEAVKKLLCEQYGGYIPWYQR